MSESATCSGTNYLMDARTAAGYASRELAVLAVPYTVSTIGRHERGDVTMQPEDAITYAKCYNAPELPMLYCRRSCPIGRQILCDVTDRKLSQLATQVYNRIRNLPGMADRLSEIADDDFVDCQEREEFEMIVVGLQEMQTVLDDLEFYLLRITQKTRQPAANRTAVQTNKVSNHHQYRTGSLACQRG